MKVKVLISMFFITLSFSSFSADGPWCGLSYRYESYHMGVANKYLQLDNKPNIIDEMCWRLGTKDAEKLNSRRDADTKCMETFLDGERAGLEGDLINNRFPQECYSLGRNYGLSQLTIYARNKDQRVGHKCIKSYNSGKAAALKDRVATPPSDNKLSYCYMSGHSDGTLFRGLL